MKKVLPLISIVLSLLFLISGLAYCSPGRQVTLNVSAGVGLIDVLKELNTKYMAEHPDVKIEANFAASGTLMEQIKNGAPTDIFISASKSHMDSLQEAGILIDSSRRNLLYNKLVLIEPSNSKLGLTGFEDLTGESVQKIAIGDPKFVPAGVYAQKTFDKLGISEQLQDRLVLCSDVRQVLTYVESGNVDAGIVYLTDAMTSQVVTVVAAAPDEINNSIVFPLSIIKTSKNVDAAGSYMDFLFSDTAREVIEKYGFTPAAE